MRPKRWQGLLQGGLGVRPEEHHQVWGGGEWRPLTRSSPSCCPDPSSYRSVTVWTFRGEHWSCQLRSCRYLWWPVWWVSTAWRIVPHMTELWGYLSKPNSLPLSIDASKSRNIPRPIKIIGNLKYLLGCLLIKINFSIFTEVKNGLLKVKKVMTNPGHIEPGHIGVRSHRRKAGADPGLAFRLIPSPQVRSGSSFYFLINLVRCQGTLRWLSSLRCHNGWMTSSSVLQGSQEGLWNCSQDCLWHRLQEGVPWFRRHRVCWSPGAGVFSLSETSLGDCFSPAMQQQRLRSISNVPY